MNTPELTPERLFEIKLLLGIAGALIVFICLPFAASWWLERQNRIARSAYQYYCHQCKRGTEWNADRTRCLECSPKAEI